MKKHPFTLSLLAFVLAVLSCSAVPAENPEITESMRKAKENFKQTVTPGS